MPVTLPCSTSSEVLIHTASGLVRICLDGLWVVLPAQGTNERPSWTVGRHAFPSGPYPGGRSSLSQETLLPGRRHITHCGSTLGCYRHPGNRSCSGPSSRRGCSLITCPSHQTREQQGWHSSQGHLDLETEFYAPDCPTSKPAETCHGSGKGAERGGLAGEHKPPKGKSTLQPHASVGLAGHRHSGPTESSWKSQQVSPNPKKQPF